MQTAAAVQSAVAPPPKARKAPKPPTAPTSAPLLSMSSGDIPVLTAPNDAMDLMADPPSAEPSSGTAPASTADEVPVVAPDVPLVPMDAVAPPGHG